MPPKKARGRLRQSEFFFPLTYHAVVANHVVQPGICPVLIQNRQGFRASSIKSVEEVDIVCVDNVFVLYY